MLTHKKKKNHRLDFESDETALTSKTAGSIHSGIVEFSRLSGLIGSYKTVAQPETSVWPYHKACNLLAERGPQII